MGVGGKNMDLKGEIISNEKNKEMFKVKKNNNKKGLQKVSQEY